MRYKKYGVDIEESYYSRPKKGRSPIRYTSRSYVDNGRLASANIKKDPRLKSHPKLEKAMMKHEMTEIKLRAKGVSLSKAHKIARTKEPKSIRKLSLTQLWDRLEKR